MSETPEQIAALGKIADQWATPPASIISKLNRGKGVVLDYVSHADVTLILCEVDPAWTYDWNRDETGNMAIRKSGQNLVLEGVLTVHGVTRPCVGTCQSNKGEPEKELTGDLIRNGAMRFGIGTKLWSKLDDATDDTRAEPAPREPTEGERQVDDLMERLKALKDRPEVAETVKTWAHSMDRSLSPGALLADDDWRGEVITMLDELDEEAASSDVEETEPAMLDLGKTEPA